MSRGETERPFHALELEFRLSKTNESDSEQKRVKAWPTPQSAAETNERATACHVSLERPTFQQTIRGTMARGVVASGEDQGREENQ